MLSCTWQPLDKCSHALLRQMLSCTWQPLDKSLGASLCHILQCTPSTYALPPHAPACAPLRFSATPFRAHPPSMPCDQAPLHTPQPPKSLPLQAPQHAPYLSALPLCPPTLCFSLSHPPCTTAGTTPPTLHLSWSHTPHVAPHIAPELAHATHLPCTTTYCVPPTLYHSWSTRGSRVTARSHTFLAWLMNLCRISISAYCAQQRRRIKQHSARVRSTAQI